MNINNKQQDQISKQKYQDFLQGRIPKEHQDYKYCEMLFLNRRKITYKQEEQSCNICFNSINIIDKTDLVCGHIFDRNCIEQWIMQQTGENKQPKCPTCRTLLFNIN